MAKDIMTAEQLRRWRAMLGVSHTRAADLLGISVSAYRNYETGRQRGQGGSERPIRHQMALACSAILSGLPPFHESVASAPAAHPISGDAADTPI